MNAENSRNFAHFRKQLDELFADVDESAKRVAGRMADVGINVTKKNTPVNKAPHVIGGTLRKGWIKTATRKVGNSYVSGYTNDVEYGMYVNNGHRIVRNGVTVGYVKGKRMLEQGINEARRQTETLFQQEIARVKRKTGF